MPIFFTVDNIPNIYNTALYRISHFCLASMSPALLPDGQTHRKAANQLFFKYKSYSPKAQLRWQQFSALPSPDILMAYCHALVDLSSENGVQWARRFMR